MINQLSRHFSVSAVIAVSIIAATTGRADAQQNAYVVNPLVSDQAGKAPIVHSNLKNAWGVAFTPAASPVCIADNATGVSTLYDGAGNIQRLVVNIPLPASPRRGSRCPETAAPNGMGWSQTTMPATAFLV